MSASDGSEGSGFPDCPTLRLEVLADESPAQPPGFLQLRRLRLRSHHPDGTSSEPYTYDYVERRATDAVVVLLHDADGNVCLRSCVRAPIAFRHRLKVPLEAPASPVIWELPAGLVEPGEVGWDGLRQAAVREALEETGFVLEPDALEKLGAPIFANPGTLADRLYYFVAMVDRAAQGVPTEDGSPLEEKAAVVWVTRAQAQQMADEGRFGDTKTELGVRRYLSLGPRP